jgi:MFS family permease
VGAAAIEVEISSETIVSELPDADWQSVAETPSPIASKQTIRTSLWASTLDGVFATVFSNITGGVLLSNFLVQLNATPTQVGLLSSIPMLANLLQPIGALLGDRTRSRHWYCIWVYVPARLIWIFLPLGILLSTWQQLNSQALVTWTLIILLASNLVGALGSASWLSWMAALVPRRLRGRYFGIRNSAASLTNLLSVPLMGFLVAAFPGGSLQGYGIVLLLGILAGIVSLAFQSLMLDVDPQVQDEIGEKERELGRGEVGDMREKNQVPLHHRFVAFLSKDINFLLFLLYVCLWMFAVNLSAPFFNLYMLDNLAIDVRWVTLYNSLQAGANMLMLVLWGKLADRVGNRSILIAVGLVVAVTPLFWIGTGMNSLSIWVWLPLLHILAGVTWAAIDLCTNNLQLGVAPTLHQSSYFAMVAAMAGVSGALGTTAGGFLAEFSEYGGIPGLFALSGVVRLVAILPLVFVHEERRQSLRQMMGILFPSRASTVAIEKSEAARMESKLIDP